MQSSKLFKHDKNIQVAYNQLEAIINSDCLQIKIYGILKTILWVIYLLYTILLLLRDTMYGYYAKLLINCEYFIEKVTNIVISTMHTGVIDSTADIDAVNLN